jgi:radical SAM protein with 4Fe4S-binding SPASM domain
MHHLLDEIDLNVTNRCNLKCVFCSYSSGPRGEHELTLDEILQFVTEARDLGLRDLHLTGGEPTLRADLPRIIEWAVSNGVNVRVITNGTRLSKRRLAAYHAAGLRKIMISLDGLAFHHENLRGVKGIYPRVMMGVEAAVQAGLQVRVSCVVTATNLGDAIPLYEECAARGVEIVSFFMFSPIGRGRHYRHLVVGPSDWLSFRQRLKEHLAARDSSQPAPVVVFERGYMPRNQGLDVLKMHGRGAGCGSIGTKTTYFLVTSQGDVFPCVFLLDSGKPIGNIRDRSLQSILCSSSWQFYKQLEKTRPIQCERCRAWTTCYGGCRGLSYLTYGYWGAPDPRCSGPDPEYVPLCPILKENLLNGRLGGSSEEVVTET